MTNESFLTLLKIDEEKYPVIAVVGGGGKTSLIYRLNAELCEKGKRVIITTTTHMAYEPGRPFAPGGEPELVKRLIKAHGYVIAARLLPGTGKIGALPGGRMEELKRRCDVMLVEADGARQQPLKVPESWEPAIPSSAGLVISVVGLDCLGKPICETAHRMERTAQLLKKELDAPVTAGDVVKIASSICGLYKNVDDRIYRVYLNKADLPGTKKAAQEIVEKLEEKQTVAAYGSLKEANR